MKYFAALLMMKDPEKNRTFREQHVAFLAEREQRGEIFARGKFLDNTGGLVIYMAPSIGEAEKIAASDPYVVSGARAWSPRMGREVHARGLGCSEGLREKQVFQFPDLADPAQVAFIARKLGAQVEPDDILGQGGGDDARPSTRTFMSSCSTPGARSSSRGRRRRGSPDLVDGDHRADSTAADQDPGPPPRTTAIPSASAISG